MTVEQSEMYSFVKNIVLARSANTFEHVEDCQNCHERKRKELDHHTDIADGEFVSRLQNFNIITTYIDTFGAVKTHTVKTRDLSPSWVLEKLVDEDHLERIEQREGEGSILQPVSGLQKYLELSTDYASPIDPKKLRRVHLREKRKRARVAELISINENVDLEMQRAAIKRSEELDPTSRGEYKYSIWRMELQKHQPDTTLKFMKDQITLARLYSSIARSNNKFDLSDSLMKHIKDSQIAIGEANSDAELHYGFGEKAKAMGQALSAARYELYDCDVMSRKLRAMVQSSEENVYALKKKNMFLMQFASWTIPKSLQCLALQLTLDYFLRGHHHAELSNKTKIEDPSLYHYVLFSDNVLSTAVVVNSTVINAKDPEKHVFHIITNKLNFAAMRMWFIKHPPLPATVCVENFEKFKWLNSSYSPVLRQLESARMKEYYFKANHPSTLSTLDEHLKYRNPKYLSMLNHLRFYMPELFPKLEKIVFLDDDVVVQKDLTPLWSIDMKGMVNGAVETCLESFHRFDTYLNFSNPKISENFDPRSCGWAFGMNIFDLKDWKKQNITDKYHYWQNLNEERQLWKLGTLPPGLIAFYNLTYALERSWHVLALGYNPSINLTEIGKAAVIHYNGNNKPWLNLGFSKYKKYWTRFVTFDDSYLQLCNLKG